MTMDPKSPLARLRLRCLVSAGIAGAALVLLPRPTLAIEGQWFFTFGGYLTSVIVTGALAALASCVAPGRPGSAVVLAALEAFLGGYLLAEVGYHLAGTRFVLPVPAGALAKPVDNLNTFALMRAWQTLVVIGAAGILWPFLDERLFLRAGDPRARAAAAGIDRSWLVLALQIVGLLVGAGVARWWLLSMGSFMAPLGLALTVTIGAAVNSCLEELIFRGVLLEAVAKASSWRVATHFTAFLFAAMHGGPMLLTAEPAVFAGLFVLYYFLSLLFAWSVADTRGIGTTCFVHTAVAATIRLTVLAEGGLLP